MDCMVLLLLPPKKTEGQSELVGAKVETSSVGRDPTGTKSQETQMLRDA